VLLEQLLIGANNGVSIGAIPILRIWRVFLCVDTSGGKMKRVIRRIGIAPMAPLIALLEQLKFSQALASFY
jgi:hypothetical protein